MTKEIHVAFITVSGPVGFVLKRGSPGSIVGAAVKPLRQIGGGR